MGRQKINQWTRYLTVVLAAIQTSFVAHWLQVNGVGAPGWGFRLSTVLTLTTGTMFVMWLGEQITERGVGNGISLLIFAGIVIGLPRRHAGFLTRQRRRHHANHRRVRHVGGDGRDYRFYRFCRGSATKIPVSYAKRHVGRQVVGGQQTTMPLKINMGGVIPVIFASSVLSMPQSVFAAFPPDPANRKLVGEGLGTSSRHFTRAIRITSSFPVADYLLHVLLRLDRFQRGRSGGQSS